MTLAFISGVEAELSARSKALTIQLVRDVDEEIARVPALVERAARRPARRGPARGRARGVRAPRGRGRRPAGGRRAAGRLARRGPPVVEAVRYLAALGHARIAYVAGVAEFVHTVQRVEAFRAIAAELGVHGEDVATDYTPESGARATRKLLLEP